VPLSQSSAREGEEVPVSKKPMAAKKDSSIILVSKALSLALARGYQMSPDAVQLLKASIASRSFSTEHVVSLVIEGKERERRSVEAAKLIEERDLREFAWQIFDDVIVESVEKSSQAIETRSPEAKPSTEVAEEGEKVDLSLSLPDLVVVSDPSSKIKPSGTEGFMKLFKSRYEKVSRLLSERPESRQAVKISDLTKIEKGTTRVIGLVLSKRLTKSGVELVLDDDTGRLTVVTSQQELKKAADEIVLDQCVMAEIVPFGEGKFAAKRFIQPDLPNRLPSTSKKTAYAIFLSDLHIGSSKFLEGSFDRFLDWLRGEARQREGEDEILHHLKYLIIAGDIVDGVGIFPNQEYELVESNVYRQYEMVSKKIAMIPSYIQILVIPGNHDATRQALPQPMIPRKYAESFYGFQNLKMLGDPSFVKLNGVSLLVFHGRSLDDVLATTPGLSYERPTEAMKVLLRARHLAPIFGSRTPVSPESEDYLVIEQAPDIFLAGHVHTVGCESYKGTLVINSGTWQAQTWYQSNLGIMPRPGFVPIVNLATFDVIFREFLVSP
jgi:DNA polymerase II small subunit